MGSFSQAKVYPPGIHVPSLTWFEGTSQQDIDWTVQKKHIEFLVKSGLHGSTSILFPHLSLRTYH